MPQSCIRFSYDFFSLQNPRVLFTLVYSLRLNVSSCYSRLLGLLKFTFLFSGWWDNDRLRARGEAKVIVEPHSTAEKLAATGATGATTEYYISRCRDTVRVGGVKACRATIINGTLTAAHILGTFRAVDNHDGARCALRIHAYRVADETEGRIGCREPSKHFRLGGHSRWELLTMLIDI